jgi:hypothetical protein
MLSEYALITVDDVRSHRLANGITLNTTPDQNIILENLINHITSMFEGFCDRRFVSRTYTEYHNGNGRSILYTANNPIISITSINVDSDWTWDASTLLSSSYYRIFDNIGIITKCCDYFEVGQQNIKVVYVAGYAVIPEDLKLACIMEVLNRFDNSKSIGVVNISVDGLSTSYSQDRFLPITTQVLKKYKTKAVV